MRLVDDFGNYGFVFFRSESASAVNENTVGVEKGDKRVYEQMLEMRKSFYAVLRPDLKIFFGIVDVFFAAAGSVEKNFIESELSSVD